MPVMQDRRRFLATLSSTAAAGLLDAPNVLGQEAPLETTRIRLYEWTSVCIAPQFVAEELLKAEGFTDVQYVRAEPTGQLPNPLLASGAVDINSQFSAPSILRIEAGDPVVFLGGMHVGCFELFGTGQIRAVRDLKGKRVAIPAFGSPHHVFLASMAAYVGLDPSRDINFVTYPANQSMQLLADSKIDALLSFPPVPQELRAKKIGHVILNSSVDRPWSQYFCCMISRESRVRSQASGGDEASDARAVESGRPMCRHARARRPHRGGPRLSVRVRAAGGARNPVREVA